MTNWSEIPLKKFGPLLRIDAEYYDPEYLSRETILKRHVLKRLGRIAVVTDGIHGSPIFEEGSGIRYISAKCVRDGYFELSRAEEISTEFHKQNPRTALRPKDIIISTVGTIGFCAIVDEEMLPANCDRHVGIVRLFDSREHDPHYIAAFINTRYGGLQTTREATGNVQLNLFIYSITKIGVPFPRQQFEIGDMVRESLRKRREAAELYRAADEVLGSELGLDAADFRSELEYETRLSAIVVAQRWDAEFYKPKYDRALNIVLKAGKVGVKRLVPTDRVIASLTNGHTPLRHDLSVGDVPFLTAEHVSDFRIDFSTEKRILRAHHRSELARTALRNGDILMTIKGKVGNCAVVVECPAEANINQDVGLLNVRPGVNSYFFCAWFNSPIGKQIVEKYSTGGINPFLGLGNVKKLPYPVIDNAAQDRIGQIVHDKVEQARIAEREAHRLMQLAENTVETLIEKKVDSDA